MLRRSLADSAGHFWHPEEFKNMANPDFENIEHLQNLGHFLLTAGSNTRIRLNHSNEKAKSNSVIPEKKTEYIFYRENACVISESMLLPPPQIKISFYL